MYIIPIDKVNIGGGHADQGVRHVEQLNPGGSIKDRIAIAMIDHAERVGVLKPGGTEAQGVSGADPRLVGGLTLTQAVTLVAAPALVAFILRLRREPAAYRFIRQAPVE